MAEKLIDNLFAADIKQAPIRNGYGEGLLVLGKENPKVIALCCDLTESTRTLDFAKAYPEIAKEAGKFGSSDYDATAYHGAPLAPVKHILGSKGSYRDIKLVRALG